MSGAVQYIEADDQDDVLLEDPFADQPAEPRSSAREWLVVTAVMIWLIAAVAIGSALMGPS